MPTNNDDHVSIILISYQSIIHNIANGFVKWGLEIVKELATRNIDCTYFVSSVVGENRYPFVKPLGIGYSVVTFLLKIINKIIKMPYCKFRLMQEKLFDLLVSLKIKGPINLVSTNFYLKRAARKNKKLGGINLLLVGAPNDNEIYNIYMKESEKHSRTIMDTYTYLPRIKYGNEGMAFYDYIICQSSIAVSGFKENVSTLQKIIFIPAPILPKVNLFPKIKVNKKGKIIFCYIAHSVWLKGLFYLVKAWELICKDVDEAELHIGGVIADANLKTYAENVVSNSSNILLLGHIEDLNKFYRSSDIFICPSLLDAGPTTVSEAMQCGLPVIVTEGCGAKDFVSDGVNGFIIQAGNPEQIAEKVHWFVKNREKIPQMGRKAFEAIEDARQKGYNKKLATELLNLFGLSPGNKGIEEIMLPK